MICDRKFIAKDIQKFYETQIEQKEINIKAGERILKEKKDKLESIQIRIDLVNKEDEKKQKDFEAEMEDLHTKMEVIQNRIKEVTGENEILNKRIQTRNEDAMKKQEEKSQLTSDVDFLKKEIISLENRLAKLQKRFKDHCPASGNNRGKHQQKQGRIHKTDKLGGNFTGSVQSNNTYSEDGAYDQDKRKGSKVKDSLVKKNAKASMAKRDDQC
mmetsp:Transcript_15434/g.17890  ORF Transcript_15434/g.17890 Transcript_15434/m.17890 type:complete len:214 (-) Transcript_15434:12-653(-)